MDITNPHGNEIGKLTEQLLIHLGFERLQSKKIAYAARFHDIGKILIPDEIINKPGYLTKDEFEVIKQHTVLGCVLLKKMNLHPEIFSYAHEICHHHHERCDGKGYPDRLREQDIPVWVQAVSLTDAYHALISKRVYKPAYTADMALKMIVDGKCGQFNYYLLDAFQECLRNGGYNEKIF